MMSTWCARSRSADSLTSRWVRTSPSPIVRATQMRTTTLIAPNSCQRRRLPRISGRDELVARAAHRPDPLRIAELAPQLRDVHVDGPGAARIRHAPDEIEQALAREDDARMLEEAGEEVELLARELDQCAADGHLVGVAPQDDLARGEHLLLVPALGTTEDRLDPGRQLAGRERLRDVVVGAELEAGDAVRLLVAGSEHDDRNLRAGADLAADFEAVHAGQADVEHDETHRLATELGDRLLPGPAPENAPAVLLLEVLLDETADRVVVLNEEEGASRCHRSHGFRIGAAPARYPPLGATAAAVWGMRSTSTSWAAPTGGHNTTTCQRRPSALSGRRCPRWMTLVVPESGICWKRPSNSRSVSCVPFTLVMTPRSRFQSCPLFSCTWARTMVGPKS